MSSGAATSAGNTTSVLFQKEKEERGIATVDKILRCNALRCLRSTTRISSEKKCMGEDEAYYY